MIINNKPEIKSRMSFTLDRDIQLKLDYVSKKHKISKSSLVNNFLVQVFEELERKGEL